MNAEGMVQVEAQVGRAWSGPQAQRNVRPREAGVGGVVDGEGLAEAGVAQYAQETPLPVGVGQRAVDVRQAGGEDGTGAGQAEEVKPAGRGLAGEGGALPLRSGHLFVSLCGECQGS